METRKEMIAENEDDAKFKRVTFAANEVIFEEGETGDAVYLIISGKVEIRGAVRSENPRILAILGEGEVIGEMALFGDCPHIASAIALEKTTVTAVSSEEFLRRVEKMDPLLKGVVEQVVQRARQMAIELVRNRREVDWASWKSH